MFNLESKDIIMLNQSVVFTEIWNSPNFSYLQSLNRIYLHHLWIRLIVYSACVEQVFSPYTSAGSLDCGIKMSSQESIGGPGSAPPPVTTSAPSLQLASHQLQTSTHMTSTATPTVPVVNLLKRPVLSSKDYESALLEEEVHSQLLYDYSTLDAWWVPRFKFSSFDKDRHHHLTCDRETL